MIDKTLWTSESLAWLGGLLEGEGSFMFDPNTKSLSISCEMTDKDIIDKCHNISGIGTVMKQPLREKRKPTWKWRSHCSLDVYALEMELFPLMGYRRRQQILDSQMKRRDYEISATGHNIRRIFTTDSGELLSYPEEFQF